MCDNLNKCIIKNIDSAGRTAAVNSQQKIKQKAYDGYSNYVLKIIKQPTVSECAFFLIKIEDQGKVRYGFCLVKIIPSPINFMQAPLSLLNNILETDETRSDAVEAKDYDNILTCGHKNNRNSFFFL